MSLVKFSSSILREPTLLHSGDGMGRPMVICSSNKQGVPIRFARKIRSAPYSVHMFQKSKCSPALLDLKTRDLCLPAAFVGLLFFFTSVSCRTFSFRRPQDDRFACVGCLGFGGMWCGLNRPGSNTGQEHDTIIHTSDSRMTPEEPMEGGGGKNVHGPAMNPNRAIYLRRESAICMSSIG